MRDNPEATGPTLRKDEVMKEGRRGGAGGRVNPRPELDPRARGGTARGEPLPPSSVPEPERRGWEAHGGWRHASQRPLPALARRDRGEEPQPGPATATFPIAIVADEAVSPEVRERARTLVVHLADAAPRPVLRARVVLRQHADPARKRPAIAKASLDVGGRVVRAQAAATQMREAVDLLAPRLRRNIVNLETRLRARR